MIRNDSESPMSREELKKKRMILLRRFAFVFFVMAVGLGDKNCSCNNGPDNPYLFQITTHTLPDGNIGTAYSAQVQATGAIGTVTWSIDQGTLPAGLSLDTPSGQITGTPTTLGSSSFLVSATDHGTGGATVKQQLSINITGGNNPVPSITSLTPNAATAGGASFSLTITGTGFVNGATVTFGADAGLSGTVTSTQIVVNIPASAIATAGTPAVTVTNPPPGGGTSNSLDFTVMTPPPTFAQSTIFGPGDTPAVDDAGDTVVVGYANAGGGGGVIYAGVFVNSSGNWTQAAVIESPTGIMSLAISGDGKTIVIGDCGNNACIGNVYVYVAPSGNWANAAFHMLPTVTLTPSNPAVSTRFGNSVATDKTGDTVAVGTPCDYTAGITLCGTVYVYLAPNGWANRTKPHEDAQLQISSTAAGNATLGLSVAMDSAGQTIVAGLPDISVANTPGAAYVFVQPGCPAACSGWVSTTNPDATLTPSSSSGPANGDKFGWAIGISGNGTTVVVGAPSHCSPLPCTPPGAGAAYVFQNFSAPGGWTTTTENALLTASSGQPGDAFGDSISVNSNGVTIVVGAPHRASSSASPGAAYVFQTLGGVWSSFNNETQLLTAFSGNDIFGNAITPESGFGGGGGFGNCCGVSLGRNSSTLAVGGLGIIGTTSNQQEVWIFQ